MPMMIRTGMSASFWNVQSRSSCKILQTSNFVYREWVVKHTDGYAGMMLWVLWYKHAKEKMKELQKKKTCNIDYAATFMAITSFFNALHFVSCASACSIVFVSVSSLFCKCCSMPRTRRWICSTCINVASTAAWETGVEVDESGVPEWGVGVPWEKTDPIAEWAANVDEDGAMSSTLWGHIRCIQSMIFSKSVYLPILACKFSHGLL
jgi:hypothetical protein